MAENGAAFHEKVAETDQKDAETDVKIAENDEKEAETLRMSDEDVKPTLDPEACPKGYEAATFEPTLVTPPQENVVADKTEEAPKYSIPIDKLSEDMAKGALEEYVSYHCLWSSKPIRNIKFTEMKPMTCFNYNLGIYGEQREIFWAFEPYLGLPVDGPEAGAAPQPWEIKVEPMEMSKVEVKQLEIPHSARVSPCFRCDGKRLLLCRPCAGTGKIDCVSCKGSGKKVFLPCFSCKGKAKKLCLDCKEKPISCPVCEGLAQLKLSLQMKVSWKMHQKNFYEDHPLPEAMMTKAKGFPVANETNVHVQPFDSFPEESIVKASQELLDAQRKELEGKEKIVKETHGVRAIRYDLVEYEANGDKGSFYVYGLDQDVYFPEPYPYRHCGRKVGPKKPAARPSP